MKKLKLRLNLRNRTALLSILGIVLILGGAVMLVDIIRSRETSLAVTPPVTSSVQTAAPSVTSAGQQVVSGKPVEIRIPSLNIDLPIVPGVYNAATQQWTLTTDKVQYATMTPAPNTAGGNTFLYGHYRKNVFASLHTSQAGAEAIVITDNGHTFHYQLSSVHVVSPEDSAGVFNYQGAPILTIQTCTGLFFQNRQLFTFNLVKAD